MAGLTIHVLFEYSNTAPDPQIAFTNDGPGIPIKYQGDSRYVSWPAHSVITLTYNGSSAWHMNGFSPSFASDSSATGFALTKAGTWEAFNNYEHPTGDGYNHIPSGGSTNNYLVYGGSSGSASWAAFPTEMTPTSHSHGSITNDGKIGTEAGYVVATTTDGALTTISLASADPNVIDNVTSTSFISAVSQSSNGQVTATKANLPTITIAGQNVAFGDEITATSLRELLNLSTALRYIGTTTTTISDGSATPTEVIIGSNTVKVATGDVVIDSSNALEYLWNGSNWERLGLDDGYKIVQTAVASTTMSNGPATSTTFIQAISQDTNGVITTYKSTLPAASTTNSGIIQIGTDSTNAAAGNHTHKYAGSSTAGGAASSAVKFSTAKSVTLTGAISGSSSSTGGWEIQTKFNAENAVKSTAVYTPLFINDSNGYISDYWKFSHYTDDTIWMRLGAAKANNISGPKGAIHLSDGKGNYFNLVTASDGNSSGNSGYTFTFPAKTGVVATLSDIPTAADATSAVATSAAGGSATTWARSDHIHSISKTTIERVLEHSVNSDVPENAVFTDTDTKNTAGSTDSTGKLFLVGAATQTDNSQTYSDSNVYTTNGTLRASKMNIFSNVTLQWNDHTQALDFVFV